MGDFVYIDESGDPGFKFNHGSTRYFVVAMLLVPDPLPIHNAVADLKKLLHYAEGYEFHFYRTRPEIRKQFLSILCRHDALVRAIVIDKQLMTKTHMKKTEIFYNYILSLLMTYDNDRLNNSRLIIDQRGKNKKNKQALSTYLRKSLNSSSGGRHRISDIRYHESHRDHLLQAVDMVASSIFQQYENADPTYVRIIKPKIDDLWVWTPRETQ